MLKINILGAEYTIEYLKRDDDPLFKKKIAIIRPPFNAHILPPRFS